jgi:AcrR family transcriptional regulator
MPRSQRTRSARAIANDQAILAAAVSEVLRVGVDHVSLRDVGHQAGLTHGATYARYEDVDELLVDLWNSTLRQRAITMFDICMHAAEVPTAVSVGAITEYMRSSTPADDACVQVLLTARRIPTLHEEVEPFIHDYLEKGSSNAEGTIATFTRGLTVFAMMLIQLLANAQFGFDEAYQDALQQLLLETLQTDPRDIGDVALREPDDRIILAPGDDLKQQLAYATFGVVGKSGYTRATISRIARRANCSPGAIYKLYLSKEDLVIAAFQDLMRARWMRISNFIDVLEEGSITQLLYNSASSENAVRQSFTLETALAAVHSDKLRIAILGQLSELEAVIPLLVNISDDEKNRLRYLIRSITFATIGVTFLSTVTNALQSTNLNQFAEPFRRAILKDCVPSWREMCHQILELVNSRGY